VPSEYSRLNYIPVALNLSLCTYWRFFVVFGKLSGSNKQYQ
jgi:hypothetical protein